MELRASIRRVTVLLAAIAAVMAFSFIIVPDQAYADGEKSGAVVPEGAPFTKVECDGENIDISVAATERLVGFGYNDEKGPLYEIAIPVAVDTVYITVPKDIVMIEGTALAGCSKSSANGIGDEAKYNSINYKDLVIDDEVVTFSVDPLLFDTDAIDRFGGKGYWGSVFKCTKMYDTLFGFTFKRICDHPSDLVTHTEAKDPSCTEKGNIESWYCSKCERYYSNETMTETVRYSALSIDELGHDFDENNGTCTRCGIHGDLTVEFIGALADSVTNESASRTEENAGLDFTFEADKNAVVSMQLPPVYDELPIDIPCLGGVLVGEVTINGQTVPNYSIYATKGTYLHKNNIENDGYYYQVYNSEGISLNSTTRCSSLSQGVQYYIGAYTKKLKKNEGTIGQGSIAIFGFTYAGDVEIHPYDIMKPDDDGVYSIPSSKMTIGSTVTILVDKTEYDKTKDLIDTIGDVTLENAAEKAAAVAEARKAYDALSDDEKDEIESARLSALVNAEQIVALAATVTEESTPEQKALVEAQIAALKQSQATIAALSQQIEDLKEASNTDHEKIAELQGNLETLQTAYSALAESAASKKELQDMIDTLTGTISELQGNLETLQTANSALAESAASKKELQEMVDTLTGTISDLQTALDEVKQSASGKDEFMQKKTAASKEITKYLDDNFAKMYKADQNSAEIAVLKALLKVRDAETEDEINGIIADAKKLIDEKVAFKTETDAKIKTAKAYSVSGLMVKAKSKKFTVTWTKTSGATGYQVQYKLKKAKKWSNLKASTTAVKAVSKKLKKGKQYSFRVRTFTMINGSKVYGVWSTAKTAKCK